MFLSAKIKLTLTNTQYTYNKDNITTFRIVTYSIEIGATLDIRYGKHQYLCRDTETLHYHYHNYYYILSLTFELLKLTGSILIFIYSWSNSFLS